MFGKNILLQRLQSEVDYLREQNKELLDRLLLLSDRQAFHESKSADYQAKQQEIEYEKVKKMDHEMIKEAEEKEAEENKIQSIMLKQMMTGEAG